ncbi:Myb-like DNA-binding domain containing protein [Tritrichomonas foetus]|uniref:Myb-like DNA-binding domain containing protein n=1 Tax=Tritrichomonas foetus TaxID=1144522 RepID=A0A1J4K4Y3_9EUKA|nr:Myb-like DNA-binding domain containing protein [Tritrichomonas foetus]|eukprot:OHT06455.1 Myb-like DNA-binding domain containing protein [Tritrichomonas foetus]
MSVTGIPNEHSSHQTSNHQAGKMQRTISTRHDTKIIKHSCRTCNRDIVDEYYIQCTKCKGFFQCLECFSVGAESINHIKTHPFVIMEPSTSPIFSSDWTAEEELLLLHAISLCGVGNWTEISLQMKTKSAAECEVHYFGTYFDVKCAPNPEMRIRNPFPLPPPLPFNTKAQESCPSCGHEKILALLGKKEKTTPAEFCGYMPKRHEFEEEYADDAEKIIDGIIFDENDTHITLDQKLKQLDIYNAALQERHFRTKLIEDWGIQDLKFKTLGGQTPREKDTDSKLLTLAPYIGREKTIELSNKLHEIARDTETIEKRQLWQENGIRTIYEGNLFSKLQTMMKDGRVPENEVTKWNKAITDYLLEHGRQNTEDAKLLSNEEIELCGKLDIAPAMFVAVKDLIIREFTLRGGLTKEEARELLPESANKVEAIYELFINKGWIQE